MIPEINNVIQWLNLLKEWLEKEGISAFFYQQLPPYLKSRKMFSRAHSRGYIIAVGSYSGGIKLWAINKNKFTKRGIVGWTKRDTKITLI